MNSRIVLIFTIISLFVSCCPCVTLTSSTDREDSTKVKVIERVEYVIDTIEVPIPIVIEKNVTVDTISLLSNDYCVSEAIVSNGLLSHSLSTTGAINMPINVPTILRDSIVYREIEVKSVEVIREKLTLKDKAVYILVGIVICLIICVLARIVFK